MKTIFFLCGICLAPFALWAQFIADFSDASLNTEIWQGDTAKFTINASQELQLFDEDAASSNTSFLAAEVATGDSTHWEFLVRQEFNPSGTNFARIYLKANTSTLTGSVEGYFLRMGGASGEVDALELYRQDGTTADLILSGQEGALAITPSTRVRISRNAEGRWRLEADYSGGTSYEDEGSVIDNTYPFGSYFGMVCRYSMTRNDKMFFDDIRIDPLFVDTQGPNLLDLQTLSATTIDLRFDEDLNPTSVAQIANYSIDNGIQIAGAALDGVNDSLVHLSLTTPLVNQQEYTLTVNNIEDSKGNPQGSQQLDFTFLEFEVAERFDILITEILVDPSPVIGLPETEYVELYNRSNKLINLENYIFADAGDEVRLPSYSLAPGAYVILYESGTGDFTPFGDILPLANLPALNNSSDELSLLSPNGDLIHDVFYLSSWYQNTSKDDGGWSLEMINPEELCTGSSNWIASESTVRGTPGLQNSVFSTASNSPPLSLLQVVPLFGGTRLQLFFNLIVDPLAAADINNYQIEGLDIVNAVPDTDRGNSVILELATSMETQTIYEVVVQLGFTDCQGRNIGDLLRREFGLAEDFGPLDMIINEVLFNPQTEGVDFVELYNRSDKIIDLSTLLIANRNDSLQVDNVKAFPFSYQLLPDRYVVLTESPDDIKMRYIVEDPTALVTVDLPGYDNTRGSVIIYINQGNESIFIDEFSYTNQFHNELLSDENGVSLERISPEAPTQEPSNWESAAQTAGFATPTYQNSQFGEALPPGNDLISLPYTTFTPNNDGFRDALILQYQTPESGYLANIRIFDTRGRLVRDLNESELLGRSGTLRWDGDNTEGNKAKMGIYLLWIELFSPNGAIERIKKNCVIGGE